jgi:tRNA-Thr(GGU) m(6)t(6)A37 methyltransferase TsaA
MTERDAYLIHPIGVVKSELSRRDDAPKQGFEGAPEAWIEIFPAFAGALEGISLNSEIIVLTWFHRARRDTLKVHPRRDSNRPLSGVFATRSPDRPNPIGLHRVTVIQIDKLRGMKVHPLEALDGTPVLDIKPVLHQSRHD